jgi:hypothetical protein
MTAKVTENLLNSSKAFDTSATVFYLKTQARWSDKKQVDVSYSKLDRDTIVNDKKI